MSPRHRPICINLFGIDNEQKILLSSFGRYNMDNLSETSDRFSVHDLVYATGFLLKLIVLK